MNKFILLFIATFIFVSNIYAQESVATFYRINDKINIDKAAYSKITALSLPFFEDFTNYETYPNPLKWKDALVYINNTFPINPISRGVATFDGLNAYGVPYDSVNKYASPPTSNTLSPPNSNTFTTLSGTSTFNVWSMCSK